MRDDPTARADLHNHLVPGVDDGARTVEDVLEGVERMTRVGIRRVVATPHLDGSMTRRPQVLAERLAAVDTAFEAARARVAERFPEVTFLRGHEVLLDHPEPDFSDDRVRLAGTAYVLVEWPHLQLPPRTGMALGRIVRRGFRPVIAHPERYHGVADNSELLYEWKAQGALLQVNYGSLVGRWGPEARLISRWILGSGMADLLATDFHGRSHLKLYVKEAQEVFDAVDAGEQFRLLTMVNPARVLEGRDPLPVQPLPAERRRGLWTRMKELLAGRPQRSGPGGAGDPGGAA
ncbi:MAG: hypothetical protein D6701_14005 [Gemmatimonadetes bacterium]|nr:MAG: hypothetical protein D6701_14005 [Gemmatimonadota bacterium]